MREGEVKRDYSADGQSWQNQLALLLASTRRLIDILADSAKKKGDNL